MFPQAPASFRSLITIKSANRRMASPANRTARIQSITVIVIPTGFPKASMKILPAERFFAAHVNKYNTGRDSSARSKKISQPVGFPLAPLAVTRFPIKKRNSKKKHCRWVILLLMIRILLQFLLSVLRPNTTPDHMLNIDPDLYGIL